MVNVIKKIGSVLSIIVFVIAGFLCGILASIFFSYSHCLSTSCRNYYSIAGGTAVMLTVVLIVVGLIIRHYSKK